MSNQPPLNNPQYSAQGNPMKPGAASTTSKKAIVSLVLGLSSVICVVFTGMAAIIFGLIANSEISKSGGRLKGQGMAIAGMILGTLGCLWTVVVLLIAMLMPAVTQVRSAARTTQSMNQVRQLVLGMHNYDSVHRQFPPAKGANPQLSWRVHLLPFMEHNHLYEQFHLDEPWDSPHNLSLVNQMPDIFVSPSVDLEPGKTVYLVPTSMPSTDAQSRKNSAAFVQGEPGPKFFDFTDGSSNTIALLEVDAAAAVTWTQPTDWMFDPKYPRDSLGEKGTFVAGFADGSAQRIDKSVDDQTLEAFFTRAAGDGY